MSKGYYPVLPQEMASILQSADAKSLVIIDELGRGTSNSDGIGLAWSISEHLQSLLGCLTLMVTHYSMMATELRRQRDSWRGTCGAEGLGLICMA